MQRPEPTVIIEVESTAGPIRVYETRGETTDIHAGDHLVYAGDYSDSMGLEPGHTYEYKISSVEHVTLEDVETGEIVRPTRSQMKHLFLNHCFKIP